LTNDQFAAKLQQLYPKVTDIDIAFCPYRVCPLGAHVDHQHGLVSGFAIDRGIRVAYAPTDNGVIEINSLNFEGRPQFHLGAVPRKQNDWADHLRGATIALHKLAATKKQELTRGVYALIEGQLPIGGLSSSAAVIIAYLTALCRANDFTLTQSEMIETALWAENEYVGVNVGRLDQSCEVYSKKDHLLFLDTLDNSFELIPKSPRAKPFEFAIFFSGVERTLVGSAFNMRVDELKAAAYALKGFSGMQYGKFSEAYLRDVPREIFEAHRSRLPENWHKRAAHFYSEIDRVQRGAEAWRAGDIEALGKLSLESGNSSIVNYETGSAELKAIYEIMLDTDGIYGGRFSGAGFKGCCMALIDPAFEDSIREQVTRRYLQQFPQYEGKFSVHYCQSADGCVF